MDSMSHWKLGLAMIIVSMAGIQGILILTVWALASSR